LRERLGLYRDQHVVGWRRVHGAAHVRSHSNTSRPSANPPPRSSIAKYREYARAVNGRSMHRNVSPENVMGNAVGWPQAVLASPCIRASHPREPDAKHTKLEADSEDGISRPQHRPPRTGRNPVRPGVLALVVAHWLAERVGVDANKSLALLYFQ
jgi:hypothetical protein